MAFPQVLPPFIRLFYNKIGIQIPILLLRLRNEIYDLICGLLQLRIFLCCQRESHCLQPFGYIGILEYRAVKFSFFSSCRNSEILQAVGWLRIRDTVIHGIPLVGDDCFSHQLHVLCPKRILYFYFLKINRL